MHLKLALATAAILATSGVSRANTINVFALSGNTTTGTLSGTVTLDATTGRFTDSLVKLLYTGSTITGGGFFNGATYTFSGAGTNVVSGTGYTSTDFVGTGGAGLFDFDLTLPFTSLIGYTGGSLCSTTATCSGQTSSIELLSSGLDNAKVTSGMLTLQSTTAPPPVVPVAVTPEPSALVLLGTGVLAMGVLLRKRYV